jgi:hypothetical protein
VIATIGPLCWEIDISSSSRPFEVSGMSAEEKIGEMHSTHSAVEGSDKKLFSVHEV